MNDELLNLDEIQNVTFARGRMLEISQALRECDRGIQNEKNELLNLLSGTPELGKFDELVNRIRPLIAQKDELRNVQKAIFKQWGVR